MSKRSRKKRRVEKAKIRKRYRKKRKPAFDFGGVILDRTNPEDDKVWDSDKFLTLPLNKKAVHMVRRAVEVYGRKNVFIVSKAREPDKVIAYLEHVHFCKKTGMNKHNVRLHKTRAGKVKSYLHHKITTVVEDRLENLNDAVEVSIPELYYFGEGRDAEDPKYKDVLNAVTRVKDMPELEEMWFG